MADPNTLTIYFLIFAIILVVISIFILIELVKVEKIARPFLLGLFSFFIITAIANFIQMAAFLIDPSSIIMDPDATAALFRNYFAVSLIYLAPLPLIYQFEKVYFVDQKWLARYHLITIIGIIFNVVFFSMTIPPAISDPLFLENFKVTDYGIMIFFTWGVIFAFLAIGVLYLAYKTSGKYRMYCLVILSGWSLNQAINGISHLLTYSVVMQFLTFIFIVKIIAVIVTAYGFIKLYTMRKS